MREILIETKKYNEAIQKNRPLSEAKEIRQRIRTLADELKTMMKAENKPG